jgi:glyoxylase-like metal-dependent hydrolase (beta-lactamase superfamily II)
MRIGEKMEDLQITMSFLGNRGIIHPALLWDDKDGATLVDTGMPGQLADIEGRLSDLGLKLTDIRGEQPLLKLDASRYESRLRALPKEQQERVRALLSSPPRVRVDRVLNGGEELPFHGGIVVIPTPGHTPGHVCYYVKAQLLLMAGDALRVEEGSLIGPSPMATPDMRRAVSSLKNLQPYRIDTVLCYHGGLAQRDVGTRLRELARIGG